jgi:hypothetical protein
VTGYSKSCCKRLEAELVTACVSIKIRRSILTPPPAPDPMITYSYPVRSTAAAMELSVASERKNCWKSIMNVNVVVDRTTFGRINECKRQETDAMKAR